MGKISVVCSQSRTDREQYSIIYIVCSLTSQKITTIFTTVKRLTKKLVNIVRFAKPLLSLSPTVHQFHNVN